MSEKKDRKFCLILYPEDASHMEALQTISESYDSAYILHDSDLTEEGTAKKEHYHVVLLFPNPRYLSAVAKDLGIATNYIQPCGKLPSALRYLIHFDNPDKFQYPIEAVRGSLRSKLEKLICNVTEEAQVLLLLNFLDDQAHVVTYRDFLYHACENGFYGSFRRLGYGVKFLLDEHNAKYLGR